MFIEIKTTTPNLEIANQIADSLVIKNLAACVQVSGPVISHYIWEGKKETSEEYLVEIKTKADYTEKIKMAIQALHPYKVPELIATEIASINPSYGEWMNQQLD